MSRPWAAEIFCTFQKAMSSTFSKCRYLHLNSKQTIEFLVALRKVIFKHIQTIFISNWYGKDGKSPVGYPTVTKNQNIKNTECANLQGTWISSNTGSTASITIHTDVPSGDHRHLQGTFKNDTMEEPASMSGWMGLTDPTILTLQVVSNKGTVTYSWAGEHIHIAMTNKPFFDQWMSSNPDFSHFSGHCEPSSCGSAAPTLVLQATVATMTSVEEICEPPAFATYTETFILESTKKTGHK